MKRSIFLSLFLLFVMVFTGCESSVKQSTGTIYNADWPYYDNPEELISVSTNIFEGKITNVLFCVMDMGKVVNGTKASNKAKLYTVYEIEATKVYKGDEKEKYYISVLGGIPGYKEEEQLKVLKECGMDNFKSIPVLKNGKQLNVDSSYLFLAVEKEADYLRVPNIDQFAFEIVPEKSEQKGPSYANIIEFYEKKKTGNG